MYAFKPHELSSFLAPLRYVQLFELEEMQFFLDYIYRLMQKSRCLSFSDKDPTAFNLSLIIGFELSICTLQGKKEMLKG